MPEHTRDAPDAGSAVRAAPPSPTPPDLDRWLPRSSLRLTARRTTDADPERLWAAAMSVELSETGLLGRLVRWRIPGTTGELPFSRLFREPPFLALEEGELSMISGMVGRIWTLRRDYPELRDPAEFRAHSQRGSARVVFGHWIEPASDGRWTLATEARVEAIGLQGRIGVGAVRPLVQRFGDLVGSDGLAAAVRRAERD